MTNLLNESAVVEAKARLRDEELLQISIESDPERFAELVARYRAAFLRKAGSILKTSADAEDAVQEAFVKIYINGKRFRKVPGASFQSWAYRILINTCLTVYRKKARERIYVSEAFDETLLETAHLDGMEHRLSRDTFLSVLSRMPEQLSSVLRQLVLLGKSLKDVAERERVSVGAIRTRLHRARKVFTQVYITVQ